MECLIQRLMVSLGCTEQSILGSIWKLLLVNNSKRSKWIPSEVFNLHPDDIQIRRKNGKQYIDLMKRTSLDTQLSIHLVRLFI